MVAPGLVSVTACTDDETESTPTIWNAREFQAIIDTAPEAQREILNDRQVTVAERELAFGRFISCADAQGVEIFDTKLSRFGGEGFNSRAKPGADLEPNFTMPSVFTEPITYTDPYNSPDGIALRCFEEFYSATGSIYGQLISDPKRRRLRSGRRCDNACESRALTCPREPAKRR